MKVKNKPALVVGLILLLLLICGSGQKMAEETSDTGSAVADFLESGPIQVIKDNIFISIIIVGLLALGIAWPKI